MTTKNFNYDMSVLQYQGQDITIFVKFKNKMIGCVTADNRLALVSPLGWVTKAKPHKKGGVKHWPLLSDYVEKHEIEWVEHEELMRDENGAVLLDKDGEKRKKTTKFWPVLADGSEAVVCKGDGTQIVGKSLLAA